MKTTVILLAILAFVSCSSGRRGLFLNDDGSVGVKKINSGTEIPGESSSKRENKRD